MGSRFNVDEDILVRSQIGFTDNRKHMGFHKTDHWPFLTVDSSSEFIMNTALQGKDSIIDFFAEEGLIADFRQHSAYEKQGIEWIDTRAIDMFKLITSTFRGKFQFYFTTKHFRYAAHTFEARVILLRYFWKLYSSFYWYIRDRKFRKQHREDIKDRFSIYHDVIDEWEERLSENKFHGGKQPDAADFKMFSLCSQHNHMFMVRMLMKGRGKDTQFENWYKDMDILTSNKY